MRFKVTTTADGKFKITHSSTPMTGDWTFNTEREAHAVRREMLLDSEWARREEAAADLAWDRYEREYGDE